MLAITLSYPMIVIEAPNDLKMPARARMRDQVSQIASTTLLSKTKRHIGEVLETVRLEF